MNVVIKASSCHCALEVNDRTFLNMNNYGFDHIGGFLLSISKVNLRKVFFLSIRVYP